MLPQRRLEWPTLINLTSQVVSNLLSDPVLSFYMVQTISERILGTIPRHPILKLDPTGLAYQINNSVNHARTVDQLGSRNQKLSVVEVKHINPILSPLLD